MVRIGIVVAFVVAAGTANAQSLGQVCSELIGSQVSECLAAGGGRYIDPNAVGHCGQLIGSQVTACVGAIAGKDYGPDEANACGGLIGSQVTDCFRRTGRRHVERRPSGPPPARYDDRRRPPRELTTADIRAEIAAALELMRAGDTPGADDRLRRLLRDLR